MELVLNQQLPWTVKNSNVFRSLQRSTTTTTRTSLFRTWLSFLSFPSFALILRYCQWL